MANPSKLGAICYEAESTWAEDVTSFATLRLPITAPVDCTGLKHEKVSPDRTVQYRNDGTAWILGTMGGSFKTKLWLTGHGTTTSGATSITLVETLLGRVFGNAAVSAASGTTATGGTSTVPITTASGTFSAGSLLRIGALNDGRGGAQFYPIATHVTTNMTLLLGTPVAVNAADVLYSATTFYPSENPTTTSVGSNRFLIQTANLMYECHGCVPIAVSFSSLAPKTVPWIEITWSVSWWRYSTATFPSTATTESFQPGPITAGSIRVQDFGTATTVATRVARDFKMDYKLGVELQPGPGGVSPYQDIVSARRTIDEIKISWSEDADAATTSPVLPGYATATTFKQVMATFSTAAGSAFGAYFPRVCVTEVPIQYTENNVNRLRFTGMAYSSTTTTTDLTLSAARFGFA